MIFEVNRQEFRQTQTVETPAQPLSDGQIRLGVERFALTSNNISYALSGDMLGYWDFFPAPAPWGHVPVMGFGTVLESAHPDIAEGGRYFGFYPMADEVVINASPSTIGFDDVGPHRADHASTYTSFANVTETIADDHIGNLYLLVRGLFLTSWLVDDYLDDNSFLGATATIVTSASSKTSIALADRLRARGHHAIGLTSPGNVNFVEALGYYDEVVAYDGVTSLDATRPTGVVDMAGNSEVLSAIHRHFADTLRFSVQVGATHWDQTGGGQEMPGPRPEFFFAPAQVTKRSKEWGPAELMARIDADLAGFFDGTSSWLTVKESSATEVDGIYRELLEGRTDPSIGHIVRMA